MRGIRGAPTTFAIRQASAHPPSPFKPCASGFSTARLLLPLLLTHMYPRSVLASVLPRLPIGSIKGINTPSSTAA